MEQGFGELGKAGMLLLGEIAGGQDDDGDLGEGGIGVESF